MSVAISMAPAYLICNPGGRGRALTPCPGQRLLRDMSTLQHATVLVTPLQQNCTLLWDSATLTAVVADPGGDVLRILDAIASLRLRVEHIWLTHGHIDHAGGAAALRDALAVPVYGPAEADRFLLDGLPAAGRQFGMTDARAITPDRWLAEGDALSIGRHAFTVRAVPGHTPGHVVMIAAADRLALVGDVLFRGSVGRTDFPYGDGAALIAGIRTVLLPLPDNVAVLCGHGPATTIGLERRGNPYLA